jgi:hypothetical protein
MALWKTDLINMAENRNSQTTFPKNCHIEFQKQIRDTFYGGMWKSQLSLLPASCWFLAWLILFD